MIDVVATIGRFQTHYLHQGHQSIIKRCFAMANKKVLIFVGDTAMNPTTRNPLSFKVRYEMIKSFITNEVDQNFIPYEIINLKDQPFSDERWSGTVDDIIESHSENDATKCLVGGKYSFIHSYDGDISVMEIPEIPGKSATEIRKNITIPEQGMFSEKECAWFRAGIIYGQVNKLYPNIYPVVDIIIWKRLKYGSLKFLLGRKHGENKWRVPGGFVNFDDESLEAAAHREVREETGLIALDHPKYLLNTMINDRRFIGVADCVLSSVFSMKYLGGEVKAGDDLEKVIWFDSKQVKLLPMIEEHKSFLKTFTEKHIL